MEGKNKRTKGSSMFVQNEKFSFVEERGCFFWKKDGLVYYLFFLKWNKKKQVKEEWILICKIRKI